MDDWVPVALEDALPPDAVLSVCHEDKRIVLFRRGDKVYALEDWCPHIGAMLSKGTFDQFTIQCPLHGVVYSVTTGAALSDPNWGPARPFPARIRDGAIEIDWSKRAYTIPHP